MRDVSSMDSVRDGDMISAERLREEFESVLDKLLVSPDSSHRLFGLLSSLKNCLPSQASIIADYADKISNLRFKKGFENYSDSGKSNLEAISNEIGRKVEKIIDSVKKEK